MGGADKQTTAAPRSAALQHAKIGKGGMGNERRQMAPAMEQSGFERGLAPSPHGPSRLDPWRPGATRQVKRVEPAERASGGGSRSAWGSPPVVQCQRLCQAPIENKVQQSLRRCKSRLRHPRMSLVARAAWRQWPPRAHLALRPIGHRQARGLDGDRIDEALGVWGWARKEAFRVAARLWLRLKPSRLEACCRSARCHRWQGRA